ncbi:MAG: hypothetical protein IPP74_04650 [Alphaproteobacteria bacterium]|nr:hypothetical protein [Alphaproteobacteria bacterium]
MSTDLASSDNRGVNSYLADALNLIASGSLNLEEFTTFLIKDNNKLLYEIYSHRWPGSEYTLDSSSEFREDARNVILAGYRTIYHMLPGIAPTMIVDEMIDRGNLEEKIYAPLYPRDQLEKKLSDHLLSNLCDNLPISQEEKMLWKNKRKHHLRNLIRGAHKAAPQKVKEPNIRDKLLSLKRAIFQLSKTLENTLLPLDSDINFFFSHKADEQLACAQLLSTCAEEIATKDGGYPWIYSPTNIKVDDNENYKYFGGIIRLKNMPDLKWLDSCVDMALVKNDQKIKKPKDGHSRVGKGVDKTAEHFVVNLCNLYYTITGKEPKVSRSGSDNVYKGEVLRFIPPILEGFKIDRAESWIFNIINSWIEGKKPTLPAPLWIENPINTNPAGL